MAFLFAFFNNEIHYQLDNYYSIIIFETVNSFLKIKVTDTRCVMTKLEQILEE